MEETKSSDDVILLSENSSTTKSDIYTFHYEWTLENFSNYPDKMIKSPSFSSTLEEIGDEWTIKIDPFYYDRLDFVAIHLLLESIKEDTDVCVNYGLTILNAKKKAVYSKYARESRLFSMKKSIAGWPRFILRSDLLNPSKKYLTDDKLIILAEISIKINPSIEIPLDHNKIDVNDQQLIDEKSNKSSKVADDIAGNKYEIPLLKKLCEDILVKIISTRDVVSVLKLHKV